MQPDVRVDRVASPPAQVTVLFDGHCRFCVQSSLLLVRLARGAVRRESFREDGVLERFAPLGFAQCEQAMQLVTTDGRVVEGAGAAVEALRTRWFGLPLSGIYRVPGLHQLANLGYAWVARNRFRLMGQTCEDGTCRMH